MKGKKMDEITPMIGMAIFFGVTAYIVRIILDHRIRRRLIDSGQIDEKIKYLYFKEQKPVAQPLSSVRWGLVLIALGLAVIIGLQYPENLREEMTLSMMFLLAGIAFLVYYFLARREAGRKLSSESQ
jgi:ABC-type branched-subunit amino acid transport system permease subunit